MMDPTLGLNPSLSPAPDRVDGRAARRPLTPFVSALVLLGLVGAISLAQDIGALSQQIDSLVQDGLYAEALEIGRRNIALASRNPELAVTIASTALGAGDLELASRAFRSAAAAEISNPALLIIGAELAMRLGDPEEARTLLRRVCQLEPDNGEAQYRLAAVLFAQGQDTEAMQRAARAVELNPKSPVYRHFYASILEGMGRRDEARNQLQEALRLAPHEGRLLLQLADQERVAGRPARAVEYLELAVESDPENPLFLRELSKVERILGRPDEAREHLSASEALDAAFLALGRSLALARAEGPEQAIAVLEPIVSSNPGFTTGALTLAGLLQKLGRDQEALDLYARVLKQRPDCRTARQESAWLHFLHGRLDQALSVLHSGDETLSAGENLLRARRNENAGNWEQALADLRRVEQRYPLDPILMQEVSRVLNEAGRPREALVYLERAYSLSPGNPDIEAEARRIRFEYAVGLEKQEDWTGAQRVFESLVQERRDSLYLFHLAYCLQRQAHLDSAVEHYREGLTLDPASEWARTNLAVCLFTGGDYDQAAVVWEALLQDARKPEYLYSLGLSRLRQLKSGEGWKLIAEAARRDYEPAVRMMHLVRRR